MEKLHTEKLVLKHLDKLFKLASHHSSSCSLCPRILRLPDWLSIGYSFLAYFYAFPKMVQKVLEHSRYCHRLRSVISGKREPAGKILVIRWHRQEVSGKGLGGYKYLTQHCPRSPSFLKRRPLSQAYNLRPHSRHQRNSKH